MNNVMRSLVVVGLVFITACVPTRTVRPLPDFVNAGLEPGDLITVTTTNGEVHEFELQAINGTLLVGNDVQIALEDISSIKKRSWARPTVPCGNQKRLGCSVPLLISIASASHDHYKEVFYDACLQHDFCYGHGLATYGKDRKTCDDEFLKDMQKQCPEPASSKIGKAFEVFDSSVGSRQTCLSVAKDFHFAVDRYGEEKFLSTTSSYCEYDGPPPVKPIASEVTTSPK